MRKAAPRTGRKSKGGKVAPKKKDGRGGARAGAGRRPSVLTAEQVDELFAGVDLQEPGGRQEAAHRVDRWVLLGKISEGKANYLIKSIRAQGLMAAEASAAKLEKLVSDATEVLKNRGLNKGRDVGPPPDGFEKRLDGTG